MEESKMRPTPGQTYTVRPGDTLRNVARAAYGNDHGARTAYPWDGYNTHRGGT